MNRVKKKITSQKQLDEMAKMYAEFREEISENMRELNTGRKVPLEVRRLLSEQNAGKLVVRNTVTGEVFRTNVNNPDYISGLLIPAQTGSKRSDETKQNSQQSQNQIIEVKYATIQKLAKYNTSKIHLEDGLLAYQMTQRKNYQKPIKIIFSG